MAGPRRPRGVYERAVAGVVHRLRHVVAFAVEGMRGGEHHIRARAGTRQRGVVAQIAHHRFGAERAQLRQTRGSAAHGAHRLAIG